MRSETTNGLQHLVLVRHNESEGDVRRKAWNRGDIRKTHRHPDLERQTPKGYVQGQVAGKWILRNIIDAYELGTFDGYFVSRALRSRQSSEALDLPEANWQIDNNLNERNRGFISGLHPRDHKRLYRRSFDEMQSDPLHWVPPGGEALIPDVVDGIHRFIRDIKDLRAVIAVTHRDRMWMAQMVLESLTERQLLAINSDDIHNGEVIHYTSVDPVYGKAVGELSWKRSFDPSSSNETPIWQKLSAH